MEEARVLERLDRIDALDRTSAAPGELLAELRGLLGEAERLARGRVSPERDFPPSFPLELALKDARLALAAAEAQGLRLGALAAVAEQMERAVEAGHGKADMAATIHASRA